MINEEISRHSLSLEARLVKASAKEVLKILKNALDGAHQQKTSFQNYLSSHSSEVKLKDMVKKGQLEEIPIKEEELRELKKELNRYGVKFSVMRDKTTDSYSVFFQAKDAKVMEKAFGNALKTAERKADTRESIHQAIGKFKNLIRGEAVADKVKHKQKEQSL